MGNCSWLEYRVPRSHMRTLAIFSVDTMTWFLPAMLSLKIDLYWSAQALKLSQGGMSRGSRRLASLFKTMNT